MSGGYNSGRQHLNIAWVLPRPSSKYRGNMPLYCEEWLVNLASDILERDEISLVNLFCGMNELGLRVDINPDVNPDICCDAHEFSKYVEYDSADVILADPPYSNALCKKLYPDIRVRLKYKVWTAECEKVLSPGGILIVYHSHMMPNPNPKVFSVVKRVFIGTRVHHTPRVAVFYRKAFGVCIVRR